MRRAVVLEDWNHFFPGVPALERLRDRIAIEIQHDVPRDREDLVARLRGAEIVVLNRERTRFDATLMDALPNLRLIVQTGGIGPNVDRAAATARGILLATGPGLPSSIEGVAELALGLLLSLTRRLPEHADRVRRGDWATPPSGILSGGTMGIVGLGRLGNHLARIGRALHMHVVAAGPTLTPERSTAAGVEFVTLDALFARADAAFICTRLSDLTRGLVTRAHIDAMRPTAYLINVARGPIVDEQALIDALRERRIAGAGLDVFDREPLPLDHPLLTLENVVLTPHIGWVTRDNTRQFVESVAASIARYLDGDHSALANPEAVARARIGARA